MMISAVMFCCETEKAVMSSITLEQSHMSTYRNGTKHKTRFKYGHVNNRRPRFTHNKVLLSQKKEKNEKKEPRSSTTMDLPYCDMPLSQTTCRGVWRRDSCNLVTLYLWWLFGVCLILCTNGGRTFMKHSAHLPTTKFLMASASYLEPDELTHELDRPGKLNLIILMGKLVKLRKS